ncbi:MAG: glycosyltransferase, partial [Chthoniobacterales bacterium]
FEDRWCFCARYGDEPKTAGLDLGKLRKLYRDCDAALNVCGSHDLNDDLLALRRLIYVESDPGVEQIKIDLGDATARDYLSRHAVLFTFGEAVGTERFPVPLQGLRWFPTRQPVVTDLWHTGAPPNDGAVFTSICNWSTSGKKDIEWRGSNYLWSKSLEFLKFVEAPRLCGETFELATDIKDAGEKQRFLDNDWRLVDPHALSIDWDRYRDYIRASKGEFTVAKDQYTRLHTGWFSDRSACYLAAGRPVITQETGFSEFYGNGEGLLPFRTSDDIVAAVSAVRSDYARHARAAREIVREYFEAEKVLASLLERAEV